MQELEPEQLVENSSTRNTLPRKASRVVLCVCSLPSLTGARNTTYPQPPRSVQESLMRHNRYRLEPIRTGVGTSRPPRARPVFM